MAKTPTRERTGGNPPTPPEEVHDPVEFEPKTPLGFALREARRKIIAAGIPMPNDEELEREVRERRGGVQRDDG
jgi:hypothetical protein